MPRTGRARRDDVEVVGIEPLDHGSDADAAVAQRIGQPDLGVRDPELPGDRRPAQVGVDEEHPVVRAAGQRAGQVDRRHRLAIARRRAADGNHPDVAPAGETFNRQPQALVLFGRKRGRRGEAYQVRVEFRHVLVITLQGRTSGSPAHSERNQSDELVIAACHVGGRRGDQRNRRERGDGGERQLDAASASAPSRSAEWRRAPAPR